METMEMARVTSKGQITIPISIRKTLGLKEGDKVLFINRGDGITVINASMQALQDLQKALRGEAERAGLKNEQDVVAMVKEVRAERASRSAHHARH